MSAAPNASDGIGRRTLLKRGLFGAALLAVGGSAALALRGTKRIPLPPEGLEVLDADEYAIVDAFCRRVVMPAKGPGAERVAFNVDRVLTRASPDVRKDVKQLVRLFENALAGFLFGGRTAPFTQLSPEAQDAVIRDWQDSSLSIRRTGYQALRTIALASYWGANEAWPAASYPGPPFRGDPNAPVFTGEGGPPRTGSGMFTPETTPAAPEEQQEKRGG